MKHYSFKKQKKTSKLELKYIILILLFGCIINTAFASNANNNEYLSEFSRSNGSQSLESYDYPMLVMVDIRPLDIVDQDADIFNDKYVIQVTSNENWKDIIKSSPNSQVMIRHESGHVCLYDYYGQYLKEVRVKGSDVLPYVSHKEQALRKPISHQGQKNAYQVGYENGGRVDPNGPWKYKMSDNKRLQPGWGYKTRESIDKQPKRTLRGRVLDLARMGPIDITSPFNYPGHFENKSIFMAYSLGVLPHIGTFFAEKHYAEKDLEEYEKYQGMRQQQQDYPIVYYENSDPENPIIQDPNFLKPAKYPVSQDFSEYEKESDYYHKYHRGMP